MALATAPNTEQEAKAKEILRGLAGFYGTEDYHLFSPIFKNVVLTDGAKYLAEKAGAYWLMDVIGSYIPRLAKRGVTFAVAQLGTNLEKRTAGFALHNGDKPQRVYARQVIPYTDFPIDAIDLYVAYSDGYWVIMLTSEY
jgi:hypothetical protein